MTGEGGGQPDDFAGADQPLLENSLSGVQSHAHGAFADEEDAGSGVAATEENSPGREGNAGRETLELGFQFGKVVCHGC